MRSLGFIFFTLFSLLTFLSGCGRHAEEFKDEPVKKDFGPILPDKTLNLSKSPRPIHSMVNSQSKTESVFSADWFSLANELLEGRTAAAPMGQNLIQSFYTLDNTNTIMTGTTNPPGSPFAEAAYWFARPLMTKAYDKSILEAESKVISAAGEVSIPISDLEKYPPPQIILQRMIQGLNEFKGKLLEQKNGDSGNGPVINTITKNIDTKFSVDLEELKQSATFDPQVPLMKNLKNLEASLAKLPEISDFDRQHLLLQVRLGIGLTEQSEAIKSSDDTLAFLVDVWLAKERRKNFPPQLKTLFAGLSEPQLFALATSNLSSIVSDNEWPTLKNETDTLILPDRSLVALYLKNNGYVIDAPDWAVLQDRVAGLDNLLKNPDISYFARLVANTPSEKLEDQRYALISNWLGVSERLGIPESIKEVFSPLSEEDLNLIGANSSPWLVVKQKINLAKFRYGLIEVLDKKGTDYVKNLFNNAIVSAIKERLDLALMPIAKTYSKQLPDVLIPILEKSRGDAEKVVSSSYSDFGRYYLGKLIFNVGNISKGDSQTEVSDNALILKHPLPLIEKTKINFAFQPAGTVQGSWVTVNSSFETSPKVLGLSLAVAPERIAQNPNEATAIEFEVISKLLVLSGYHDKQNNLTESFMTAMTPGHTGELFNVETYDPSKVVFAVPDVVRLKGSFKMSAESRVNPSVSVEGQMDLLYGYAKLMEFFKPWQPSPFDSQLGAIRVDEAKGIEPFSRSDYFLLSVGLGAYILKNIPVEMLGLINSSNQFIDATKVKDPSQVSAVAATMTDYTPNGMSHKLTTRSLAKAILGMSAFYAEIKDLQKSSEPRISSQIKGDSFQENQEGLQKLISGLVLFATTNLKSEDGGFLPGFDLDKMKPSSTERTLSDQLLMEEALLSAGRSLQSGFMISRAIENLYFLNSHFWDEDLGFYRMTESDSQGQVWLVDVARAIHNIQTILTPTDLTQGPNEQSLGQMQQMRDLWISRFFSQETQKLSPLLQVSEFSL